MRNHINMTTMSKVIYKCDEVQGVMPCSNIHKTTDVRMDQSQWYFNSNSFSEWFSYCRTSEIVFTSWDINFSELT